MSWILGNPSTSFGTDLSSLWHNATTGELTTDQKTQIATGATQDLSACSGDPSTWSQACIDAYNANKSTVDAAAPNSNCILNVPGLPCFESWNSVLFAVVAVAFGFLALYGIVVNYPTVVALRRK